MQRVSSSSLLCLEASLICSVLMQKETSVYIRHAVRFLFIDLYISQKYFFLSLHPTEISKNMMAK